LAGSLAASLLLAGGCGSPSAFTPPPDPRVGKPAPAFVFHSVHGRVFPSDNLNGRNTFILFMRAGQPDLQTLLREVEKMRNDPSFLGVEWMVLVPENDPLTIPFWTGLHNTLPVALDFTDVAGRFGAGALPLVVIRDQHGIIRLRLDGFVGAQLLPRLAAARKILREVEGERTRLGGASP